MAAHHITHILTLMWQPGAQEAYRVVKEGGVACMIGPVYPTHPVSRFFADVWMLFPTEEEYVEVRAWGRQLGT